MLPLVLGASRIPVPNSGACDWGLGNAGIRANCKTCKQYYDPRPQFGNTDGGVCVYVPGKDKCFAARYARNQNYEIANCGEF